MVMNFSCHRNGRRKREDRNPFSQRQLRSACPESRPLRCSRAGQHRFQVGIGRHSSDADRQAQAIVRPLVAEAPASNDWRMYLPPPRRFLDSRIVTQEKKIAPRDAG